MSDNQASFKARYVSGDDFARFVEAKVKVATCLRCGSGSWELHDTDNSRGLAGQINDQDGKISGRQLSLVSLGCLDCGTIWALDRGVVVTWLDENPHGDEDSHG